MRMKLILPLLFLALMFFPLALAEQTAQVCEFVPGATLDPVPGSDIPLRQTAYSTFIDIPKFDPGLGVLEKVYLDIDACGRQDFKLDNEDPQPLSTFDVSHSGLIRVVVPAPVSDILELEISDTSQFTLPADNDGTPDFVGTDSYAKLIELCTDAPVNKVYDQPSDLAEFTASGPGIPEVMSLAVNSSGSVSHSGDTGNFAQSVLTYMGAEVCVVYEYAVPLCINGTKTDACTGEGLTGWEICLTGPDGIPVCTTTGPNGDYSFCDLVPGDYEVCETPQAGWKPVGPTCIPVTLPVDGGSAEDINFVNEPPFCINGTKFNGTTDEGLPGWTIDLKDAAGAVIATKTTGADGSYSFCGLFSGTYTVCERPQSGWTPITPTCITVTLECADSENNNFRNRITPPPSVPPCGPGCPWFIKNELYTASCTEIKEVGADKGLLANEMFDNVVVLNPENITIDPKYGSIEVFEDGSFVYDPTGATALRNGVYVIFKYGANNGLCDAKYLGIAKIQIACH